MKILTLLILLTLHHSYAEEQEGDLLLPVADIEQIERQEEEELPPELDDVEMKQKSIDKKELRQSERKSCQSSQADDLCTDRE